MTDTPASLSYGDYLGLDQLLGAQHPISSLHDEMLFIVIHQTKELWLKQIIRELKISLDLVREDALIQVHKSLSRVSRIQAVMTLSWDVLATMTPSDYSSFRDVLGSQFGLSVGAISSNGVHARAEGQRPPQHHPEESTDHADIGAALREPSLWDEAIRALARAGFDLPAEAIERNWSRRYQPSDAVEAAWATVYQDPSRFWPLYQLAEKLVDIDDSLATWRHKHVVTVERVIGLKPGTGGTAGVAYLQSTLSKRAFPELWSLRTRL
jgi:tryptophan 2,3-dioxygenase